MLLLLHGRSSTPDDLDSHELHDAGANREEGSTRRARQWGDHSYYHDRRDGKWGSYVIREVIPTVVRRYHADGRRVAIGGFSMGGFGALDIARLHPGRFCAVGGHSAALWDSGGETPAGAYDDAEDFARHDVLGAARSNPQLYGRTKVWLDVGTEDPVLHADGAGARSALPRLARCTARATGGRTWTTICASTRTSCEAVSAGRG